MDIVVDDHTDGLKTLTQEHFSPKINHTEESPFVRGTLLLAGLVKAFRVLARILEYYFYGLTVHIDYLMFIIPNYAQTSSKTINTVIPQLTSDPVNEFFG
jgi:hypothetical protein